MEGFLYEKPNTNSEQIDLTLKLSLCGQNATEEEKMVMIRSSSSTFGGKAKRTMMGNGAFAQGEKGLVRFGDLQTMRRVRSGKRLLLKKMQRAAAAQAEKKLFPEPLPHSVHDDLRTFANTSRDLWHQGGGGASSHFLTLHKQEINDGMVSPKVMQEMRLWPSETMIERPWTF